MVTDENNMMSLPLAPLSLNPVATRTITRYHDSKLPHLSALLDADFMAAQLQSLLHASSSTPPSQQGQRQQQLIGCQIKRVKYKPQKNCLVIYQLHLRDRKTGKTQTIAITCRTYEHHASKRRYHKARQENNGEPSVFPAVFHLPQIETVGWIFPCERKLLSLSFVNNPHYLKHVLMPPLVKQVWGDQWQIETVSSAVVHYVPEHTCMVKVTCTLMNRHHHTRRQQTLFGKCYYNHAGAHTFDIMTQLAEASRLAQTPLRFPAPLYYDQERKILWQESLNGQTLRDAGISRESHSSLLPMAAKALAQFHCLTLHTNDTPSDHKQLLEHLKNRAKTLRPIKQLNQQKLQWLIHALQVGANQLSSYQAVTLHGDAHSQNLFLEQDTIAFIDLDDVTIGHPLLDLASWMGGMIYWATMNKRPLDDFLTELSYFAHHYNQHAPQPITNYDLNWYIAALLVNERIFRCVARLKSGRLEIVADLLVLAKQFAQQQYRLLP